MIGDNISTLHWSDRRISATKDSSRSTSVAYTSGSINDIKITAITDEEQEVEQGAHRLYTKVPESYVQEMILMEHGTGLIVADNVSPLSYYHCLKDSTFRPSNFTVDISHPVSLANGKQVHPSCHVTRNCITGDVASCTNTDGCRTGSIQMFKADSIAGQFQFLGEWNSISPIGLQKSLFISTHELIVMPLSYMNASTVLYHLDTRSSKLDDLFTHMNTKMGSIQSIYSVSTVPERPNMLITGGNHGLICVWDLRRISQPLSAFKLHHKGSKVENFVDIVVDILIHRNNIYATTIDGSLFRSNFDVYDYVGDDDNIFAPIRNDIQPRIISIKDESLIGFKELEDRITPLVMM